MDFNWDGRQHKKKLNNLASGFTHWHFQYSKIGLFAARHHIR